MNELVDLRVFVEVAKRLSFTDAATSLGINKSAASKAVSRIEDRLGVKLLQRSTRKLSLTEEGNRLFDKSSAAFSSITDAEHEITSNQQQLKGKLRIAAPMSYGLTTLVKLIPGFMAKYPRVTVELHLEDQLSEIIGEGFDVAIRSIGCIERVRIHVRACRRAINSNPTSAIKCLCSSSDET